MDYQIGIIGAGVAGCFSLLRLLDNDFTGKVGLFELGRPFAKRRRQLEGALGCLPAGDGKFYLNDFNQVDGRSRKKIKNWVFKQLDQVSDNDVVKDTLPSKEMQNILTNNGYSFNTNDYIQWKPENIHSFSKIIAKQFEANKNITIHFDTQVFKLLKKRDKFLISTENGDFTCKKLILAPGRSGWRWASDFYKEMGLSLSDDTSRYGVRFELPSQHMSKFNESNITLTKGDTTIGPLTWYGTIMPEDHADMVISCFRSNESRWKSEKVAFSYIREFNYPNEGIANTERLAKLTYLLFNDRVSKEKNQVFLKGNSQLNDLPEYKWLKDSIFELEKIIPQFASTGTYHVPHISCMPDKIKLTNTMQTDLEGLCVAGEAANFSGFLGAMSSGALAADGIME